MDGHLKESTSDNDDNINDDDLDGVGLSQSRASLIQTSFFSSNRDKMFTPIKFREESTEYAFRKFEGRMSDTVLQQSIIGQGCYGLDWTDVFERSKIGGIVWNEIDLRQDQGITDAVLYSLLQNKESLMDITQMDISGCIHVTDAGIYWLTQMLPSCPSLRKISMDGCREITERSLLSLGRHGNDLTVSARGTGVMFSPVSLMKSNCYFHLDGCPLVDDVSFTDSAEEDCSAHGQVVICPGAGQRYSLADYLTRNKQTEFHGVTYKRNWKAEDCILNVVEVSLTHPSAAILVSPRVTQVIIPCDTDTDVEQTKNHIISTMTHFLSKEVYVEKADPVASYMRKWSVGPLVGAEVDVTTGVVEILHKINVSSTQMPNFTTLEPLSKLRPYFEIELLHAGNDEKSLEVSVSIGVRCRPYFPKPAITNRYVEIKKKVKVGDRLGIGVENINMLADTYLAEGSTVQLNGRLGKETFRLPEFTLYGDDCPFIHIQSAGARFKVINYDCRHEEEEKTQITEGKYFSPSELNTGCIMDIPSGILSYASLCTTVTDDCPAVVCRMKESLSQDHCEFAVKILKCSERCHVMVGIISELCFREPLGGQPGTIGYSAFDGRIHDGSQMSDVPTTNTDDFICHVGDIMKVKVSGFASKFVQSGDLLHISFYKNDTLVGDREWRYDVDQGRLLPAISLQSSGEQVFLPNCSNLPDREISHMLENATKERFLLKGTSFLRLQGHQLECVRDLSHSMAEITNFQTANSLSRQHAHFEVRLSHMGKKRELGIGLVHGGYSVERMPGWEKGSIGWHFEHGKVFVEQKRAKEEATAEVFEGDVVGCGFDVTDVTFDDTGIPRSNQTLSVYFTRNGGEVLRQEFYYRGGGLHPAVGMSCIGSKVDLMNLLDPLVYEKQQVNHDTGGGVRFIISASGSGPVENILRDVEESFKQISAGLHQQEVEFTLKSCLSLSDHRWFSQLVRGRENLDRFLTHKDLRLKILAVNRCTDEGRSELVNMIVANQRAAEQWQPYQYRQWGQLHMVSQFTQAVSDRQPVVSKDELRSQLENLCGQPAMLDRILTLLNDWGHIIYIPEFLPNLIVTNIGWFVDTLTRLCQDTSDILTSDAVTCLVSPTACWSDKSLHKMKVEKLDDLLEVVMAAHQMLRVIPPRRHVTDDRFFLIHALSLPDAPDPALVRKFWQSTDSSEEDIMKARKRYSFPFGFTQHTFFVALAACCQFCRPLLLWKRGLIWHQGTVEMVLILQSEAGNKEVMYLQGKCLCLPAKGSSIQSSTSDVRKHLLSVFSLYDDIVQYAFIKLQQNVFIESNSEISNGNTVICSQHAWFHTSENKLITVCTICNICSEHGLSCDHNGIMGSNYRECECHTLQTCCMNCGICRRCAEGFWEMQSFLRPQLWNPESDTEKTTLISGTTRYVTMATLNAETVNEVMLTAPSGGDHKSELNICLMRSDRETLIDAFPGRATLCSPEEDYLVAMRTWWKDVYVEEELALKPWDTVQLRLRECQQMVQGQTRCMLKTCGAPRCAFHMCRNIQVWPSRRIIGYDGGGSGGKPLGILVGATNISSPDKYFELEILQTGSEGCLRIGIVPNDYPDDTTPGSTGHSIALVTDQKGIFLDGEKISRCPPCHVGDRLGFQVTFDDKNQMTVTFLHNNEQIWRGAYDPGQTVVRPALSLQCRSDVVRLSGYHDTWCVVHKEFGHELRPGIYVDDLIRIRPSEVLTFTEKTAELHLESLADVALLYKIKVTNHTRYIVRPTSVGVLGPATRAVTVTVCVKSGNSTDFAGDKLKILWTRLEDKKAHKDVEELWKIAIAAKNKTYNRELTVEWQDHLEYADNFDPGLVPLTSADIPTQASYCLELRRNGKAVNEYYIPRADYHLVLETHSLPFVNFPKSPNCKRFGTVDATVNDSQRVICGDICTEQTRHFTVLEAQLTHLSPCLKTWDTPREHEIDTTYICVFLPGKLSSHDTLLYPSLRDLAPSSSLVVHQLCKSFDMKPLHYSDTVYNHVHFIDAKGITPIKPVPVEYIVSDLVMAWAYAELSTAQVMLPSYSNLLGEMADRLDRKQVEHAFQYIVSRYTAMCHLSSIKHGGLPMMPCHANHAIVIQQCLPMKSDCDYCSSNFSDDEDFEFKDPTKIISGLCKAHDNTKVAAERHGQFDLSLVEPYGELLSILTYDIQDVENLPDELPSTVNRLNVLELLSAQTLQTFPADIGVMKHLKKLQMKENHLSFLPSQIGECTMLEDLIIYRSYIDELPASLVDCHNLHRLVAHTMLLGKLPDHFDKLQHLVELNLNHNPMQTLPQGFGRLPALRILKLSGVPWMPHKHYDLDQYLMWHKKSPQNRKILSDEVLLALFDKCDKDKTGELDDRQMATLNAHLFYMIPRLGHKSQGGTTVEGSLPDEIFELRHLEELELQYQAITSLSSRIGQLQSLKALNLSHCLRLESLPGAVGELPNLESLRLKGCAMLTTPPIEVVSHGVESVIAYLKKLAAGSTENWRTKLMLVGLGGVGKTSLLKALMNKDHKTRPLRKEDITDGIDITNWTVERDDATITFSTWDFAGQTVYYNTHQFFLSQRAIYLLLWTVRQGYEHAGLDFWLSSIQSHAPKVPIFIVGTHSDQVKKVDLPKIKLMKQYPQIKGFHFVSSIEGHGIAELESAIVDVTLREKYMGEKVPTVYLKLEEKILAERKQGSGVIEWTKMTQLALRSGISDEKEIKSAVQFLHDLGTVQYFDNDFLRDHIVINPQWIVDVMACIVSVKDSPIMDGYFQHSDIGKVWSTYPNDLHKWLLRLTEEFDLTFPLPDQPINIIPCLLPQTEPEFSFLVEDDHSLMKETVMLYKFAYLPAGLFNRAQVRLFQFTNGEMIWKHGSLLTKNSNRALVHQQSEKEMLVRVRGPRPENFLFLLHEVIEGLIAESYQGVSYDFLIPCPDCLHTFGINDPCMFPASLIKLATDKNVPFLQCHKHFHTVSMPILQETLPPESSSDLDAQISDNVRILNELRHDLSQDFFISYHPSNIPSVEDERVNPLDVAADLEKAGYTCWKKELTESNLQDRTIALKDAKLLVVFMSREYEMDEAHRTTFLYAKDVLHKPFVIVTIGDDAWKDTELGCAIGPQEVYVSMKNIHLYDQKLDELKKIVKRKLESLRKDGMPLPCFVSYSWSNSRSAVNRGTRHVEGALGAGDPRKIKEALESKGIHCWLDIEQVGQSGLYRDISLGIKEASIIVACISEQYANSLNCMMELRFATCRLNKPVVFVVVGTGDDWLYGELGMLIERSRAPIINMQHESSDIQYEELAALVSEKVGEAERVLERRLPQKSNSAPAAVITMSFHEEYELAQRKFLRHVSMLVVGIDTSLYPRLFLIDFSSQSESSYQRSESHTSAAATLGQTTRDSRHVTWQEGGKSLDSVSADWSRQHLTVKLLCEHDKGWHCADQELPLVGMNTSKKVKLVESSAAFLARILILMKHSGINLNCMMGNDGDSFVYFVNRNAKETTEDFASAYNSLWKEIRAQDQNKTMGGLRRCHLPTGQIRWLCRQHSEAAHIRVLSNDVAMATAHKPLLAEEDRMLSCYINEYANAIEQWPALSAEEKSKLLSASKHRFAPKLKIPQVRKKILQMSPTSTTSLDDETDAIENPDFARTLPLSKVAVQLVAPKLSSTLSWPGLSHDVVSKEKLRQQAAARFGLQQQTSTACIIL